MPVATPTQHFVPVKEVRDGLIVLTDGGMRAVLMASSLNLSLKSEDEQKAIILQFQNFLNSLDFSIQISAQSRRLDIRPYIALLERRSHEVSGDLLRVQINEYIGFVKSFTEATNIMTKTFYIVIPYSAPLIGGKTSLLDSLPFGKSKRKAEVFEAEKVSFEESRSQIEQRVSVVQQGLSRVGVRLARLGTEEVVELLYKTFNPGENEKPIVMQ